MYTNPTYKKIKILLYGFWGILLFHGTILTAQENVQTYFFEGDEVVFQFDSRAYAKAIQEKTGEQLDFADLDINKVIVTGKINNWSKAGWKMKKVGKYLYQLRKKILDFNDPFTWDFKFLINGKYWADPNESSSKKMYTNDFLEDVYDMDLYEIKSSEDGNTLFTLSGFEDAKQVILAGSFVHWDENYLKMEKVAGGWQIRIDLPPGRHEYKFIVDGAWMHDPANRNKKRNQHGTFNSILFVNKQITFSLPGFPDAERVILAGSFNNWKENDIRMERTNGEWTVSLELTAGKHFYKFIIDGKWIVDPLNPLRERDRDGNVNSVLIIQ